MSSVPIVYLFLFFRTLTRNIRQRRNKKVAINIPGDSRFYLILYLVNKSIHCLCRTLSNPSQCSVCNRPGENCTYTVDLNINFLLCGVNIGLQGLSSQATNTCISTV